MGAFPGIPSLPLGPGLNPLPLPLPLVINGGPLTRLDLEPGLVLGIGRIFSSLASLLRMLAF